MGATYTRGFPNPIVWPLRSCSQLKSHPATYARGATYTRVITVATSWPIFSNLPLYIEIYRVGDNITANMLFKYNDRE